MFQLRPPNSTGFPIWQWAALTAVAFVALACCGRTSTANEPESPRGTRTNSLDAADAQAPDRQSTEQDDDGDKEPDDGDKDPDRPAYETLRLRGQVVYAAEALERLFGIESVPEAEERHLVLETPSGDLHPLVEDIRGRSFRKDERLRERPLTLLVRRYKGSPFIQVIQIFADKEAGLYELDYWCEICSIAMFELKPCDCCQGPVELRERLVEKQDSEEQDSAEKGGATSGEEE